MEVWAKQDPAAAERWVDGIDDPTTRRIALVALLKGAVETAPDLVERRLTEIDGIHEPNLLVNLLAWKLDPTRFPSLADRLLSWRRTTWGAQDQIDSLLGIWGQRDGPAMMAWLTGQAPGRLHDHVLLNVAESRAKADPAAFVREIGPSLADNETLAEMAGQAWLRWLQTGDDPDGAMDWFQTHGEHLTGDSSWYWSEWTEESAGRALAHLSGLPDGTQKQQFIQRVLRGLSSTDAKVALDHGKSLLPPGEETDLFFVDTLSSLAWGDPAGALDWALRNLEAGGAQRAAVQSVMGNWAMTNPLAAMERARSLPAPLQASVDTGIVHHWVQSAPDQVLGYLKGRPGLEADALAHLARGAFRNLGSKRGGEAYLAEALALPGDALRSQAVRGLFNGWSSANAETAATALQTFAPGPLRDIAIEEFARQVGGVDREAAFAWSFEIGDPAKRRTTVLDQGRRWLNADREAATRWIETSATLPEAWKAELLKPAP